MNSPAFFPQDIIIKKRDGGSLTRAELQFFAQGVADGRFADYQATALLMAIFWRGLTAEETAWLTDAMLHSGDVIDLRDLPGAKVDKHSTGGVGDKVSLILAPLAAACGILVPMMSGRGLGHTGGTLDKLEAIPGFRVMLEAPEFRAILARTGLAMIGQTPRVVPADRKLYALRDVTGTVPSIPLITASILSKKLAEGLDALVMDVKFGAAAFMQSEGQARELAQAIVHLAQACGVKTRAMLTDMNTPLGGAAGNWLEVKESVECLEGRGPSDLLELVVACAAHLLELTGRVATLAAGRELALRCLTSGEPRRKWDELIVAQGGDLDGFQRKLASGPGARVVRELKAPRSGHVTRCDARIIGEVIRDLGGGRLTKDTVIQPEVGVDQLAKPGERRRAGELLCRIHASTADAADRAARRLAAAFGQGEEPPLLRPLIRDVV